MKLRHNNRGFLAIVIVFLLILGGVGLYFGYKWHTQRNFINLYDGSMTRQLDMPPFAERVTDAERELIGECVISIGTSHEQTSDFYKSICDRYGYLFTSTDKGLTIEVRKNYSIAGEYKGDKLSLSWTPVLPEKLKKQAQEKFAAEIAKKAAEKQTD